MALTVIFDVKSAIKRVLVLGGFALVSAAYAEDRVMHHDWRWSCYSLAASLVFLFLLYGEVYMIIRALSRNND